MYRVLPLTYLISGMLSTGVANTYTRCADIELLRFDSSTNQTCQQLMSAWINGTDGQPGAGGYSSDSAATSNCGYCTYDDTNVFLQQVVISYGDA